LIVVQVKVTVLVKMMRVVQVKVRMILVPMLSPTLLKRPKKLNPKKLTPKKLTPMLLLMLIPMKTPLKKIQLIYIKEEEEINSIKLIQDITTLLKEDITTWHKPEMSLLAHQKVLLLNGVRTSLIQDMRCIMTISQVPKGSELTLEQSQKISKEQILEMINS